MDNLSRFHRKRIANMGVISIELDGRSVLIAQTMAKKTQRGTKYCSAARLFAQLSRISPGVWAIR
jgi:hypothetical protein